jgi:heme/copper-type cytochrome/quinol oxidase subunit 3
MKYIKLAYIWAGWIFFIFCLAFYFYHVIFPEKVGHSDGMVLIYIMSRGLILSLFGCFLAAHSLNRNQKATKLGWAIFAFAAPILISVILTQIYTSIK